MKRLPTLLVAMAATALFTSGTARADDPTVKFERYKLDNGMEVILHQDNSVPLVAVNVWYHVGSGDETLGKSGFAHLFEHMLFQGSEHIVRCFCDTCGTKIRNRFPTWTPGGKELVAFFPSTLDEATQHDLPDALQPKKHNRPEETVLHAEMLASFFDDH